MKSRGARRQKPDWSKLPQEFAYLTAAAERFGPLVDSDGTPRRRLSTRELKDLREIARQIGQNNHELLLQSWLIQCAGGKDSRAERLISDLLDLLAALNLDISDSGPKKEPEWTLSMWERVHYRLLSHGLPEHTRTVLPEEMAFSVAAKTLERVPREELGRVALLVLHSFRSERVLDWVEVHLPEVVSRGNWTYLVAVSQFSWPRAQSWLARGRPLSLVALDALAEFGCGSESPIVQEADPTLLEPPPFSAAERVLREYAAKDQVPRVQRAVASILDRWSYITGQERMSKDKTRSMPDWSKIPEEFAYLTAPAERFGPLQLDPTDPARRLKPRAHEELSEVGKQIGWHNHDLALRSWINQKRLKGKKAKEFAGGDEPEAMLFDALLILLYRLGIDTSDYGPKDEPEWTLRAWETFHYSVFPELVGHTRELFTEPEAFKVVSRALERLPREPLGVTAFQTLHPFRTSLALDWLEAHAFDFDRRSIWFLGELAAVSEFSWARAESWLARGRPLSVFALGALRCLAGARDSAAVQAQRASLLQPPDRAVAETILRDYAAKDPTPRVRQTVASIVERWSSVVGTRQTEGDAHGGKGM